MVCNVSFNYYSIQMVCNVCYNYYNIQMVCNVCYNYYNIQMVCNVCYNYYNIQMVCNVCYNYYNIQMVCNVCYNYYNIQMVCNVCYTLFTATNSVHANPCLLIKMWKIKIKMKHAKHANSSVVCSCFHEIPAYYRWRRWLMMLLANNHALALNLLMLQNLFTMTEHSIFK